MYQASSSYGFGVGSVGENRPPRRFGRLRPRAVDQPQLETESGVVADKESGRSNRVMPFDWAKTFVGPNGTYYDERWRWMEWRDKHQSWNWAAALSFGVWFAYRRLYGWAVLFFGWLMTLLAIALTGVNLHLLAIAQVLVAVIAGRYANALYRQRFRHMAVEVARDRNEHAERLAALRCVGGVDLPSTWLMVLAMVAGAIMVIWRNQNSVGIQW